MNKFAAALTAGLASAMDTVTPDLPIDDIQSKYLMYLSKFGKAITTGEEFTTRLLNFANIDSKINEINAQGNSWIAGHNQFSDWSSDEFESLLGNIEQDEITTHIEHHSDLIPDSINWVELGGVTPVKD